MTEPETPLVEKYLDELAMTERGDGGAVLFANGNGTMFLRPGAWLLAMEHCQTEHNYQPLGSPQCISDLREGNHQVCVNCAYEDHTDRE